MANHDNDISTYGLTLKYGTAAGTYANEVYIKDFPDIGGTPDSLETTTTVDAAQTYILGIMKSDGTLPFTMNYDSAVKKSFDDNKGTVLYWQLTFSDGSNFTWAGACVCTVKGKAVNNVVEMTLTVECRTVPAFAVGAR